MVWAKARDFRDRATEYLNRARVASDGDVQRRFVDIAQHHRILAEAEASNAGRLGNSDAGRRRLLKVEDPTGALKFKLSG